MQRYLSPTINADEIGIECAYPCQKTRSGGESSHCGKKDGKVFCGGVGCSDEDCEANDNEREWKDDPDTTTFHPVRHVGHRNRERASKKVWLQLV